MRRLMHWFGMEPNPVSMKEKLISSLGAFAGIALTALISLQFVDARDAMLMIGSMGASAVLLFAVPHGQLSQPWPALAGQLVSASVGVTCALLIPNSLLAAALAVSLAVLAMHLTRSVHPPGGATALIAVIGGPGVHALGYWYVAAPVALNAISILLVALAFNNLFGWRRYPAASMPSPGGEAHLSKTVELQDIALAVQQIDSIMDVTEDELLTVYRLAEQHAQQRRHPLVNK